VGEHKVVVGTQRLQWSYVYLLREYNKRHVKDIELMAEPVYNGTKTRRMKYTLNREKQTQTLQPNSPILRTVEC
jgi:hypothetical protein